MGTRGWRQQKNSDDVCSLQIIMTTCRIFSQLACHHDMAQCAPPLAMIGLKFNGDSPQIFVRMVLQYGDKRAAATEKLRQCLFTAGHNDYLPYLFLIGMPSWHGSMRSPPCHDRPEIHWRLTLDISKDGPVIWGQEGGGNRRTQTMFVHCRS